MRKSYLCLAALLAVALLAVLPTASAAEEYQVPLHGVSLITEAYNGSKEYNKKCLTCQLPVYIDLRESTPIEGAFKYVFKWYTSETEPEVITTFSIKEDITIIEYELCEGCGNASQDTYTPFEVIKKSQWVDYSLEGLIERLNITDGMLPAGKYIINRQAWMGIGESADIVPMDFGVDDQVHSAWAEWVGGMNCIGYYTFDGPDYYNLWEPGCATGAAGNLTAVGTVINGTVGVFGESITLPDGSGNYLVSESNTTITGTSDSTFTARFNFSSTNFLDGLMAFGNNVGNKQRRIRLMTGGSGALELAGFGGSSCYIDVDISLFAMEWVSIVGVISNGGATQEVYINGQLNASCSIGFTGTEDSPFYIGAVFPASTQNTHGMIDEAGLFDGAWTADMAMAAYVNGTRSLLIDLEPPAWSAELNVTPANYTALALSNFSIDWSADTTTVKCLVNVSGSLTEYTPSEAAPPKWNFTIQGVVAGTHYWQCNATDAAGNLNDTMPWLKFNIGGEILTIPPSYSNAVNVTPATFDPSAQLNFSIDWTDNGTVTLILIEMNRSGTLTNHTPSNGTGPDTYNLTLTDFPAGTHYWRSWANDTYGNTNTTPWYSFTIGRAAPILNLTLNGTEGPVTIDGDSSVWLNGSVITGDSNYLIELAVDAASKGQGSAAVINNLTTFNTPGTFNISLNYTTTQNYSYRMTSYLLTASDTTPPAFSNLFNESPATFDASAQIHMNLTWQDNVGVTGVSIEVNRSGVETVYQASNVSATVWNLTLSGFPAGTHYWRSNASDAAGNENFTGWNAFTIGKATPTLNLTLNGTAGSISIKKNSSVWLNGSLLTGDGGATLSLFLDSSPKGSGITVANLTAFPNRGDFNVSLNYTSTENYSASMISYFVTVANTLPTTVTLLTPANNSNVSSTSVAFSWSTSTDADGDLVNYYLFLDGSEELLTDPTSISWDIASGTHTWYVRAYDGTDGSNSTPFNFTSTANAPLGESSDEYYGAGGGGMAPISPEPALDISALGNISLIQRLRGVSEKFTWSQWWDDVKLWAGLLWSGGELQVLSQALPGGDMLVETLEFPIPEPLQGLSELSWWEWGLYLIIALFVVYVVAYIGITVIYPAIGALGGLGVIIVMIIITVIASRLGG